MINQTKARHLFAAWPLWMVLFVSLLLTGLLGYLDYLTGYDKSLLLFYLLPIALATWFGDVLFGFLFSILAVVAWFLSDLEARVPRAGFWNLAMALAAYIVFTFLLSKLRTVFNELDERVRERTKALRHEMNERQRLDREIAEVADRERRRIGQELHDSLGQHLTGTALAAQTLREKLASRAVPEVVDADKIVQHLEDGIELTRNLARGFFSPELEADGLSVALHGLAENMTERFKVTCNSDSDEHVRVPDSAVATQLYRIAQEAVMNAIKHADAQRIDIRLANGNDLVTLSIDDDGKGFPDKLPSSDGLGLRLMSHGAALVGAAFDVRRNGERGTSVICTLKLPSASH